VGYLIDTSIFIAWERDELTAERVLNEERGSEPVALSVVTASELLHGVHRAATAAQRGKREAFVGALLTSIPVLPVDLDVARVHARVWSDLRSRGELIGAHDLWIAATALRHGFRLATRNVRDFDRIADLVIDVW
jgi:tRNA(fMet)-specific endonuclease VapC